MSAASLDPTYLLVPMHVDALVVGQAPAGFKWASFAPHFSELQDNYATGFDLRLDQMFRKATTTPPKQGIHLHFKLPAALTHGGGSEDVQFPRVPNRWLVQRYDSDSGRLSRAWIVRGDKAADRASGAVSFPIFPASPSKYDAALSLRPTGVSTVVYDGDRLLAPVHEDDTPSELELTAVTGGDAGFSAHYPACRSMLGLHDHMAGVPYGVRLSYLVTGWYSSTKDDPWHQLVVSLKGMPSAPDAIEQLEQWLSDHRCVRAFPDLASLPSSMLCHGLVAGVPWNPACDYSTAKPFRKDHPLFAAFDAPPFEPFADLTQYSIDIGNNSAEAIASLVAGTSRHQDLVEDVLTGIQTGLVSVEATSSSDGLDVAEMDEDVHRRGFAGVAGGLAWAVRPSEPALPASEQRPRPLPRHLQDLLDDLNASQVECNRHARLQADYRRELYALWHRWTAALMEDGPADLLRANLDGLRAFLANFDRLPEVAAATKKRDAARQALLDALAKEAAGDHAQEYSLDESAAAPFYLPADPVFLLSGPAMKPVGTYAQQGVVRCRVDGEEIAGYTYDEPNGAMGINVSAETCMEGRVPRDYLDAIPTASRRLLGEALVLDEVNRLDPAKKRIAKERPFGSGIRPDDISLFRWQHNPWMPLYVAWEVDWRSDYDASALPENLIGERWTFGDEAGAGAGTYITRTDLVLRRDARAPSADTTATYRGFSLLQPVADRPGHDAQAPATVTMVMGRKLGERLQNRDRPVMAQTAAGFHDALIMRRVGDQLPPLDYQRFAADRDRRPLFLDRIAGDLGPAAVFDSSPAIDTPFLPLRSGAMKVRRAWIVDAFGQTIWLDPAPAGRLATRIAAGAPDGDGYVPLRPRFSQPMRLSFAAAAADNPEKLAPASSPVCGWVVPNHLEQSLTLYAANGTPVGVLQRRFRPAIGSGKSAFYWVDVPGRATAPAGPPPESAIENRHLRDFGRFVLSLDADQGAAFARLIDQAISATDQRVPEEDPGVSVLVGRPLAVVRATFRLESPGLLALDQQGSWQASDRIVERLTAGFAQSAETSDLLKTGGVERLRCPVRLGDRRTANEGLIGFFVGDPAAAPRPLYASWGFDLGNVRYPNVLETQDQVSPLAVDGVTPLVVTLLMDPQARVHATTGVLPRAFLELRAAESAGAKQAREVFFQTAPVLGAPAAPQVPTPSDDYGEWSWAYRPDVTLWAEDPALVAAADREGFSVPYPTISEGWLKLKIAAVRILSLWVRNGTGKPAKGTNIWLAWSVYGADSLRLDRIVEGSNVPEVRTPVWEWRDAPLGREIKLSVDRTTTFELIATDRSDNADRKRITIEIDGEGQGASARTASP